MSKKNEIKVKGKIYISAKEAANITHYTSDYVGQLSRANKIGSTKIGHTRFVNKNELLRYTENGNKQKRSFREKEHLATQTGRDGKGETLNKGKQEYQTISTTKVTELDYFNEDVPLVPEIEKTKKQENEKSKKLEIKKSFSNIKSPFTSHSQFVSDLFFKKVLVFFLAISLTFGPYFLGTRTGIANAAYEGVVSVVKIAKEISREVYTRIDEKGPLVFIIDAVSDTKKIVKKEGFKLVASVPSSGLSFKGVAAKFYVAVNSLFESEGEIILVNEDSTEELNKLKEDLEILKNRKNISTKTIVVEAPGKIVERIIEKTSSNAITKNELEDRLQKLDNKLSAEIYTISAGSPLSVQTVYRAVSHTNKIDKLRNTDITTPTVVGGTISGVSITGATYEGSALTITGTADIGGSATITGDTTIGGQLFVSGTATSTIAGDVNFDSNTLYIDSVNNRIGIGTTTPQYTLDIDGTLNVSSIVTSGGQTTGGDFAVTGDTTLGNATSSDTTYFNSRIGTSLIPTSDNVLDLGGESDWLRWRAAILGTSLGIGGTATSTGVSLLSSGNYLIDSASGLSINTTNNATTTFGSGVVTVPNLTTTNLTATNATTTNATTTNLAVTNLTLYTAPTAPYFTATSTTATSTFAGGVTISGTLRAQGPVNQTALSVDRLDLGVQDGTPRMVFEDSGSPIWLIDNSVGRFRWYIPGIEQMNLETSSNNATLSLRDASTRKIQLNTAGNTYFNGGNVGINDTTPTYKLDVNGTGRFTGALTLDSTLGVTGATTLAGILDVTGLSTFSQASTTRFSIFDTLYVGGTATSTLTSTQLAFPGAGTIDSSSGTLTLNSTALDINNTGAITVGTNGSEQNITFETQNFDVNSTGTVTIDGTTFTYTPTDTYTVNATGAVSIDSLAGSTLSGAGINITSDGANAVTVTYASTGGTFELTDGTTRLSFADNGDSVLGDDTSTTQLDGSTITLSGNTVIVGTITQTITDNSADALDIQEGTNNYINITTTNGSESIAFGNTTTNPTFNFLGSGLVSGTNTTFTNATTTSATTTNIAITSDATFNNLTASRLLSLNSSGTVSNTDLNSWITGTSNQVTVTDDTDGTVTLSLPSQLSFTNASTTLLSVFNGFWAGATATTSISAGGDLTVGGGDIILGSTSIFSGGDTASLNNIDAIDATTETTIETAIDTLVNLTSASSLATVGALDSGSITSNFGTINTGTSNITTTGTISGGNLVATGTSATSTFAGGLAVETSGLVYDYSTGNVGIGTAAPGAGLHIEDNNMKITGFGGTQERIYLSGNSNNPYIELFGSGTTKAKINSSGYSYFNGGNVGIGTTTPASSLAVSGGASIGANYNIVAPTNGLIIEGNVGIGTTSPGAKLDVNGSITSNDIITAGSASYFSVGGTTLSLNNLNQGGVANVFDINPNINLRLFRSTSDSGAQFQILQPNTATPKFVVYATSGNITTLGALTVSGTGDTTIAGNVGIGTTTPYSRLSIWGDGSNNIFEAVDNASSTKMVITNAGNVGIGTTSPIAGLSIENSDYQKSGISIGRGGGKHNMLIYPYNTVQSGFVFRDQTDSQDLMIINGDGNVGIGTTTPASSLAVSGGASIGANYNIAAPTNGLIIEGNVGIGTTGPNNNLHIIKDTTNLASTATDADFGFRISEGVGNDRSLLFGVDDVNGFGAIQTMDSGTSWTTIPLSLQPRGGNVGIGTTTPYSRLSIWGDGSNNIFEAVDNASSTKMVITNAGNVGIGTTSPTRKLQVNGMIYANAGRNDTAGQLIGDYTGSDGYWNIRTSLTGSAFNLDMYNAGTWITPLTVQQDGNVGIGTTAPTRKLTIGGTTGMGLRVVSSNDANYQSSLIVNYDSTHPFSLTGTQNQEILGQYQNNNIRLGITGGNVGIGTTTPASSLAVSGGASIGANYNIAAPTNGLIIEGNVGIGTTSPSAKLEIISPVNSYPTSATPSLSLRQTSNNAYGWDWIQDSQIDGDLYFHRVINDVSSVVMSFDRGTGNVGIGTTTPASSLAVSGGASIGANYNIAAPTNGLIIEGNVGIGTASPGAKLEVRGGTQAWNGISLNPDTGTIVGRGNLHLSADNGNVNAGSFMTFKIDSDEKVRIDSSGNVGIGTVSPQAKVDIYDNTDNSAIDIRTYTGGLDIINDQGALSYGLLRFRGWTGAETLSTSDGTYIQGITNGNNDVDLAFGNYVSGGTITEIMRLKSNGNVGIGTVSPSFVEGTGLHIADAIAPALRLQSTGSINSDFTIYSPNGSNDLRIYHENTATDIFTIQSGGNVGIGTTTPYSRLSIWGDGSNNIFEAVDNASSTKMVITNAGNVGIGTTSPNYKLHLLGTGHNIVESETSGTGDFVGGYRLTTPSGSWGIFTGAAGHTLNGDFGIYDYDSSAYRLWIQDNGNVGIGTTTPSAKLDVYDDGLTISSVVARFGKVDSTGRWDITSGGSPTTRRLLNGYNGTTKTISLDPGGGVSYFNNGNVGIGTTTPSYLLDVDGDFRVGEAGNSDAFFVNATSGNVGIGTASPSVKLDIAGSNNLGSRIRLERTDVGRILQMGASRDVSNVPYIGSESNNGFALITNNTERVRIDTSGNVGIGTISSGAKLHVKGSLRIEDSTDTTTRDQILEVDTTGALTFTDSVGGERMRINYAGNVGIGTTAPTRKLTIGGTTGMGLRVVSSNDANYQSSLIVNYDSTHPFSLTGTQNQEILGQYQNNNIRLGITGGNVGIGTTTPYSRLSIWGDGSNNIFEAVDNASSTKMVITNAGNVGIGTTNPTEKFVIEQTLNVDVWQKIKGFDSKSSGIMLGETEGTGGIINRGFDIYHDGANNLLKIDRHDNSDTGTNALTIVRSNGNVGIGTTAPLAKLEVRDSTNTSAVNIQDYTGGLLVSNNQQIAGSYGAIKIAGWTAVDGVYFKSIGNANDDVDLAIGSFNNTGSSEYMRILNNGNVGIGTTTPYSRLSIWGDGSNNIFEAVDNASSTKMVITNAGNVGIGTASPSAKLEVEGSGSRVRIDTLSGSSGGFEVQASTGTNNPYGRFLLEGVGSTPYLNIQAGDNVAYRAIALNPNGGNVGIGTNSPSSKLDVSGTLAVTGGTGTTAGLNGLHSFFTSNTGYITSTQSGTSNRDLVIQALNINLKANGADAMYIKNGGNVGIGTTSPGASLDIKSKVGVVSFQVEAVTSSNYLARLTTSGSNAVWSLYSNLGNEDIRLNAGGDSYINSGNVGIGTTTPYSRLSIWGDGSNNIFEAVDNASSTKMVITNAGNVGIGTTTPTHLLTVGTASGGAVCVDNGAGGCNGASNIAGDIYYSAAHSSYTDIAEKYPSLENLEAGDIVSVDRERNIESKPYVKRATRQDTALLGVISTKPGLTLGDNYGKSEDYSVALSGRVPVKVSLENGKIEPGDRISLSAFLDGVGRKAGENESSVGISLGKFDNNSGENYISPLPETTDLVKIREIASEEFVIQAEANQIEVGSVLMFVDLDIRNGDDLIKNDIQYYDNLSYEKVLDVIGGVDVVTYVKKVGDEERQIDILEKNAPKEILSVSGGISMYKLTILNLAGVKALNIKLNNLEARVSALESVVGTGLQPVLGEEGNQSIFQAFLTYLEGLGVKITNGFATFKNLIASTLKVGTPEKPSGITLYDDVTGEPYCLKIANGAMVSNSGECEILDVADSNGGSVGVVGDTATTTPSGAPVITLNGLNPATIAISSSYSDMGIGVVDSVTGNELGYTTSVSGGFLSQPVEFASGMQISLDTATSTTYTITYTAVSQDGVEATAERIVVVGDGGSTPVDLTNSGSEAIATTTATTTNSGDGVNATTTPTTTATTTSP